MGQEVAFRQIVQTQKERKLCLEKYGDFTGNNETKDLAGRLLWRRWAQLYF